MPAPYVLSPDTRSVGSGNPPGDMNAATDALNAIGAAIAGITGTAGISGYAGGNMSGAPTSGTYSTNQFVINQDGTVWACTAGGTPGTWVQAPLSFVPVSQVGAASGVASLDSSGLVPVAELPVSATPIFIPGTGVPSSGLGMNGDAYWNVADGSFYLKASGAWTRAAGTLGSLLCPPVQYAPGSQTILSTPSTTVAAGSNGGTITTIASWATPSAGVLAVASTTGPPAFPASGTLNVTTSGGTGVITYTGTSGGNSFTGCAFVSGSGTVSTAAGIGPPMMAVSSANINTGSFTAPDSGAVIVTACFTAYNSAAANTCAFGLAAHGTTTMAGYSTGVKLATANPTTMTMDWVLTGLTAGSTYNFDLMYQIAQGAILSVYAYGGNTGNNLVLYSATFGGPVIMYVRGT